MDRLPSVIQKEIWEYVHGNRAYWRQQHQQVTDEVNMVIEETEYAFFCHGGLGSKTKWLVKKSVLQPDDRAFWTRRIPAFMKCQHESGGQLFADTRREFDQKDQEWHEWREANRLPQL